MEERASPWRRLVAFGLDGLLIAGYTALLTGAGFGVLRALKRRPDPPRTLPGRLLGHVAGALTLTLPVALASALAESSSWQATPGKRALGLRVTTMDGGRVPLGRAVLRAAVKFAPWELAHAALWHTPGWPVKPAPTAFTFLGAGGAQLLAASYVVSLFVGSRRPLYDRAAGTRVLPPVV